MLMTPEIQTMRGWRHLFIITTTAQEKFYIHLFYG